MRVSMSSYHHNPYRQSSASCTPQQVVCRRLPKEQRTATRTTTQESLQPLPPDQEAAIERISTQGLSEVTAGTLVQSNVRVTRVDTVRGVTCASVKKKASDFVSVHSSAGAASLDGGGIAAPATLVTTAAASNLACISFHAHPTPLSSPLDDVSSPYASLTSPLHRLPLQLLRHSANAGGIDAPVNKSTPGPLPSASTPTWSCQAQSSSSTTAVDRHSSFDCCATAVYDDYSISPRLSSSGRSPTNAGLQRCTMPTAVISPASPEDTVFRTLFIDGLPASIENKWQLRPCVPPHGLVALRVKSSRGRNVGFAVYDNITSTCDALQWFQQLHRIKETLQGSRFSAPHSLPLAGGSGDDVTGLSVGLEAAPLEYEDYLSVRQFPDRFAFLLRSCTLLRVDWARSWAAPPTPANVAAVPPPLPASGSVASTSLSHPSSTATLVVHVGREPNLGGDGYSHGPQMTRRVPPPQTPSQHSPPPPPPPPLALLPSFQPSNQPPHPGITVSWADTHATHLPAHTSLASSALHYARPPATRSSRGFSAPSTFTQTSKPCHSSCAGAATAACHEHHQLTCQQLSLSTNASSHLMEGDDVRERVDGWRSLRSESPASFCRQDERHLPLHSLSSHRCQPAREPPLPSRTLFVRLIHNFDAPEFLQQDQLESRTGSATTMHLNFSLARRGPPSIISEITPGLAGITAAACAEVAPPRAPSRFSQPTALSFNTPLPNAAMLVVSAADNSSPVSALPYHHRHRTCYQSPSCASLMATPQPRHPLESRSPEESSSLQTPPSLQRTIPRDELCCSSSGGSGAGGALRSTLSTRDHEFFRIAQSVLCSDFFSEKFAGFLRYREFLRPPFYGGCFVLFERGEDMQRCLQWMRKDERLMRLFAVAPARSDSFGP